MNVLITGAKGFIGKNLCWALKNIAEGKDRRSDFAALLPLKVFECDSSTEQDQLRFWCSQADAVIHLAGANRPTELKDFKRINCDFTKTVVGYLENNNNNCPIFFSSSIQAAQSASNQENEYARTKNEAEKILEKHAEIMNSRVIIARLPNIFGKWCKPNYNSVVATFCYNIAHNLPVYIDDQNKEVVFAYVDDLVELILMGLVNNFENFEFDFLNKLNTSKVQLGYLADKIMEFREAREQGRIVETKENSFDRKLYSTYMSYLDPSDFSYNIEAKKDDRGSFAEFLKASDFGQISINVTKPGEVKGQHWHQSKWEKFCVVSGEGLIRVRKIGFDKNEDLYPIYEYRVNGDNYQVIEMIPGYTHSIENISKTSDLITIIWANEVFDHSNPDTYYMTV